MATQFKASDYQHITVPGSPPQHIRVAFVGGKAVSAVDSAMSKLPTDVRDRSLDELQFRSMTERLIAIARDKLSQRMFSAFLRWGETASHFSTRYETDEEAEGRCDAASAALQQICDAPAINIQDVLLRTYLLAAEVADSPSFGPFDRNALDSKHRVDRLASAAANDIQWLSPVVATLNEVGEAAWASSDPTLLAIDVAIGTAITAAFSYARGEYAASIHAPRHVEWLAERNAVMVECEAAGASDDADHDARLDRLNALDSLILRTPASSSDEMLAQLVLATQVSAEGSCLEEKDAAKLIQQCARLTGLGSLAGASKDLGA